MPPQERIPSNPLKGKRARFVDEYLLDLNGAAAAVRAGYSARTARSTASELLGREDIAAAIAEAMTARAKRTGVTADQVVAELARVAFADIRDVVSWAGMDDPETGERSRFVMQWRDSKAIPAGAAAAISEVSQTANGFKVKLHPKVKALELLAQHLGMFEQLGAGNDGEEEPRPTPETIADMAARARLRVVGGMK